MGRKATDWTERFWARVQKADGCWEWQGSLTKVGGYGKFVLSDRKHLSAHRVAYELMVGPIPEGLELDHLCRNKRCVNPAHLEAVTHQENITRGYQAIMAAPKERKRFKKKIADRTMKRRAEAYRDHVAKMNSASQPD